MSVKEPEKLLEKVSVMIQDMQAYYAGVTEKSDFDEIFGDRLNDIVTTHGFAIADQTPMYSSEYKKLICHKMNSQFIATDNNNFCLNRNVLADSVFLKIENELGAKGINSVIRKFEQLSNAIDRNHPDFSSHEIKTACVEAYAQDLCEPKHDVFCVLPFHQCRN